MGDITQLLQSAREGDASAVSRLTALLYDELHRLAHARLRRHAAPPLLLDTTSLLHESYLRLSRLDSLPVASRAHFMAYAARVMRSVVVDLVREARSERRGGDQVLVTLNTANAGGVSAGSEQIVAVHEALQALADVDPRLVQVVEMRYFGGLEMDEIAAALGLGKRTVERDWEKARSFLYASLKSG